MSNRVFKNYQINLGVPFQVKVPLDDLFEDYYGSIDSDDGEFIPISPGGRINALGGDRHISAGANNGGRRPDKLNRGRTIGASRLEEFGSEGAGIGLDADAITDPFADSNITADSDPDLDPGADPDSGEDIIGAARAEANRLLMEARAEGADIVAAANAESKKILEKVKHEADAYYGAKYEQAEAEAARLRKQALREGEAVGREEGRAEYDALVEAAQQLRDEAKEEYRIMMAGAEDDALELILGIAKKVIGEEITQNHDSLLHVIKDAFFHCTNKDDVVLKVSSVDFDDVLLNRDRLLSMVEGLGKLDIKRDLALAQGACLIETPFGNLNAGISSRISKIEDAFYRVLADCRPSPMDGEAGL